jgi:cytochrome b6-f complex iron-sulfur subunit
MSELEQSIQHEHVDSKRRAFMQNSLKALSAVLMLELGASGLLFLRARSMEGEFGGVITAGPVDSFPPGTVTEFEEGNFFLVRTADSGFMAIFRRCPHLGCTVEWIPAKEKFFCPCHSASFDPNGDYQTSIVSNSLGTFTILFEDGMVKVDTSQVLSRAHHKPEHVSYQ